jgi:hypothetical protein
MYIKTNGAHVTGKVLFEKYVYSNLEYIYLH